MELSRDFQQLVRKLVEDEVRRTVGQFDKAIADLVTAAAPIFAQKIAGTISVIPFRSPHEEQCQRLSDQLQEVATWFGDHQTFLAIHQQTLTYHGLWERVLHTLARSADIPF